MAEGLEPCPFCGNAAAFGGIVDRPPRYFVNCVMCQASVGEALGYAHEEDAAQAWNTRTLTKQTEPVGDEQIEHVSLVIEQELYRLLGIQDFSARLIAKAVLASLKGNQHVG